ncbi:MAG TPA: BPSS1780 family membrane protein [Rhodanobacteraceae bacterium]|nr:BPSS1780 family membrane protein [Rhodanobacteraceae bacterium]
MQLRHVRAGTGFHWIRQAFASVGKQPGTFLCMGLIVGLISCVPILGPLVVFILGPAMLGGIAWAARVSDRGGSARIGDLMHAFRDNARTNSMIALCLPLFGALIVAVIILAVAIGGALVGKQIDPAGIDAMQLLRESGGAGVVALALVVVVMLVGESMVFFAIPRVILDGVPARTAMGESFRACRRNLGAWLLALLTLAMGCGLVSALLAHAGLQLLGSLVADTLYYAVGGPTLYHAWDAVFAPSAASGEPPDAAAGDAPAAIQQVDRTF